MADDLDTIKNPNNTAIDIYRSSDAAPDTIESLRFWLTNELRRIQDGFISTDEALKVIANAIPEATAPIIETPDTPTECPECEDGFSPYIGPNGNWFDVNGDTGVQAEGTDGEDGNAGDLINDAIIVYDKTWSSRKISDEDAAKLNISDYDQYKMKWRGVWVPGDLYLLNDVTRDGDWSMIAITETTDRPAPQPIGDEEDNLDSTPVFTNPTYTGVVRSGLRYQMIKSGWLTKLEIWVPVVSIDYVYKLYIVQNTTPPVVTKLVIPPLTANEWNTVGVSSTLIVEGADIAVILDAYNSSSSTSETGDWTRGSNSNAGAPDDQSWNRNTQNTVVRIDYNENGGVDRSAALANIIPGSTITFTDTGDISSFISFYVNETIDNGTYYEYEVSLINTGAGGEPGVGTLTTMDAVIPVHSPTEYSTEVDYWLTNSSPTWATVTGFLEFDGTQQVAETDDLFGINLTFQDAERSPDWQVVALSNTGGTGTIGTGGGDGEANELADVGGGDGLSAGKSGIDLLIKSLTATAPMALTSSGTEIDISTTAPTVQPGTVVGETLRWNGTEWENTTELTVAAGIVKGLFTGVGVTQADSKIEVVSALPGTTDPNTLYFVVI